MRRIMSGIAVSSVLLMSAAVWADDQVANSSNTGSSDSYTVKDPSGNTTATSDQSNTYSYNQNQKNAQEMAQNQDSTAMQHQQAGTADTSATGTEGGVTQAEAKEEPSGMLNNEKLALQPMAGTVLMRDALGESSARMAAGIGMDWNLASTFAPGTPTFFGISTGGIFSHIGSAGSNFFGTNSATNVSDPGANMLIIPGNIKIGYTFSDRFRASLRGGANIVYRSVANSSFFGSENSVGTGSDWTVFPNVGADFEIGVAPNVAVLLRPDYTFTTGNNFFTGMIGVGLNIG